MLVLRPLSLPGEHFLWMCLHAPCSIQNTAEKTPLMDTRGSPSKELLFSISQYRMQTNPGDAQLRAAAHGWRRPQVSKDSAGPSTLHTNIEVLFKKNSPSGG